MGAALAVGSFVFVILVGAAINCSQPAPAPPTRTLPNGAVSAPSKFVLCSGDTIAYLGSCGDLLAEGIYNCSVCWGTEGCVTQGYQYCVVGGLCSDDNCKAPKK